MFPVGEGFDAEDERVLAVLAHDFGRLAEPPDAFIERGGMAHKIQKVAGWPCRADVAEGKVAVRFVLRRERPHVRSHRLCHFVDVARPAFAVERMRPPGFVAVFLIDHPRWEREVPERDDRLDSCRFELARHIDIVPQGLLVIAPRLGLDARPLDAESVMVDPDLFESLQIAIKMRPAECRVISLRRNPLRFRKEIPVGFKIIWSPWLFRAVLILERAGCDPPPKRPGRRLRRKVRPHDPRCRRRSDASRQQDANQTGSQKL